MINELIEGISMKLNQLFDDYEIYTETIEQGLKPPCFLIKLINPNKEQQLGTHNLVYYPFDIMFFPNYYNNPNSTKKDIYTVSDILFQELDYITLVDGSLKRGINMDMTIDDNVLHFNITFLISFYKKEINDKVQKYSSTQNFSD